MVQVGGAWCARRVNCGVGGVVGGVSSEVGVVAMVMVLAREVCGVVALVEAEVAVRGGAGVAVLEWPDPLPASVTASVPELEPGSGIE